MCARLRVLALSVCLAAGPALAQQNAVGLGVGQSSATANPTATATGGQGGQAATNGQNSLTINNAGGDSVLEQRGGTVSRLRSSGTQRILTPGQISLGLAGGGGFENCSITAGLGGAFPGGSVALGLPVQDEGCSSRNDAKVLAGLGMKAGAIARLCQRAEIGRALWDVCPQYAPQPAPQSTGFFATAPVAVAPAQPRLEPVERPARGQVVTVIYKGRERQCGDFDGRRCLRWASR
jgi:hypothetical protein